MRRKTIKAVVKPSEKPVSRGRLGEIAEQLLQLLHEERRRAKERAAKGRKKA